jgi:hypothetical protein
MAELRQLQDRLKWAPTERNSRKLPKWFGNWKPKLDDIPDVVVDDLLEHPENTVLLEVMGSELTPSPTFVPFTLRFPRVCHIRHNKPVEDADTEEGIARLYNQNGGKLSRQVVPGAGRGVAVGARQVTGKRKRAEGAAVNRRACEWGSGIGGEGSGIGGDVGVGDFRWSAFILHRFVRSFVCLFVLGCG